MRNLIRGKDHKNSVKYSYMRLVSIDQPESENPNEETSFEIEEEDALTQGGFSK